MIRMAGPMNGLGVGVGVAVGVGVGVGVRVAVGVGVGLAVGAGVGLVVDVGVSKGDCGVGPADSLAATEVHAVKSKPNNITTLENNILLVYIPYASRSDDGWQKGIVFGSGYSCCGE